MMKFEIDLNNLHTDNLEEFCILKTLSVINSNFYCSTTNPLHVVFHPHIHLPIEHDMKMVQINLEKMIDDMIGDDCDGSFDGEIQRLQILADALNLMSTKVNAKIKEINNYEWE